MTDEIELSSCFALTYIDIATALGAYHRAVKDDTVPAQLMRLSDLTDRALSERDTDNEAIKAVSDYMAKVIIYYVTIQHQSHDSH
mgnify:CR=1 FL=1|tara:strand:- start:30563 stop:30817 length:255 start_codon:yes stop_codon:yes gene_type:complete